VAVGGSSRATDDDTIAVGNDANATAQFASAVGKGTRATADGATTLGNDADAEDTDCLAIGRGSRAGVSASRPRSTAIGGATVADAADTLALGYGADASATGDHAHATALGGGSSAEGQDALAVGYNASATGFKSVAIGPNCSTDENNVARISGDVDGVIMGTSEFTVGDADLNNEEMTIQIDESAGAFRLVARDSNGTIQSANVSW